MSREIIFSINNWSINSQKWQFPIKIIFSLFFFSFFSQSFGDFSGTSIVIKRQHPTEKISAKIRKISSGIFKPCLAKNVLNLYPLSLEKNLLENEKNRASRGFIYYFGAEERKDYLCEPGPDKKVIYSKNKELVTTDSFGEASSWNAVLSNEGELYIFSPKNLKRLKGGKEIYHSSILSGEPCAFAGEINISFGVIIGINNKSGHYLPCSIHLCEFVKYIARKFNVSSEVVINNSRHTKLANMVKEKLPSSDKTRLSILESAQGSFTGIEVFLRKTQAQIDFIKSSSINQSSIQDLFRKLDIQ